MLPTNLNFEKKEGGTYEPIPEDMYQVELLDIELQEKPTYDDKTKMEKVLSFQFVLLDALRGRSIWKNFVPTYLYVGKNGKNTLYQVTEGLIGRALTDEEEALGITSDYLNDLIGKQVRVTVKNKAGKEGKVFSNIVDFFPARTLINALTEDEKEKAQVKNKKETTMQEEAFMTNHQGDNMSDEDIPVILGNPSEEVEEAILNEAIRSM